MVVARALREWDARSLLYVKHIVVDTFERRCRRRFPVSLTSSNSSSRSISVVSKTSNRRRHGVDANQVAVPVGQKPFVRRAAADVVELPANTDVQRQRPVRQSPATEPAEQQPAKRVAHQHAGVGPKEDQQR